MIWLCVYRKDFKSTYAFGVSGHTRNRVLSSPFSYLKSNRSGPRRKFRRRCDDINNARMNSMKKKAKKKEATTGNP